MIGNQNGTEEVEARGKGEHSYYKQKGSMFHRAEETGTQWRSDKGLEGCGRASIGVRGSAESQGHDRYTAEKSCPCSVFPTW